MSKSNWRGKNGPLLIAEIGGNHEGDFEYAKKLVKLAIETRVDIIKLQLYQGKTLVSPFESKDRFEHFKKFELTKKEHIYLAQMCIDSKTKYLSSIWDLDMLDWVDDFLEYYKIGSGDLTAYPIIKEFCKKGKPIIISTGLSDLEDIKKSVDFIQNQNPIYKNKNYLAILQCTSSYPTLDEEVNLRVIQTLKNETKMTIGYSNHNIGSLALRGAYLCGAEVFEFHFTDTREGKSFRDHKISLTPTETKDLINDFKKKPNEIKINKSETDRLAILMGNKEKKPTKGEISSNNLISFRRAIYSNKFLNKGDKLKEEDLVFLRPNHGIDSREYKKIIGKKIKKNTQPFEKLELES
tara:strand:- start:2838 stop:3893 length:1056 start_codon:yes stop_codon:yes gene_type:complete